MSKILACDAQGTPRGWIPLKDAISYHATDSVAWEFGDEEFVFRGGYQNGKQSIIYTKSIIAIKSVGDFALAKLRKDVVLTNKTLFGRDRNMCAYCGRTFINKNKLSRDHIKPRSRGGLDVWENVVTACKDCNCDKDDQLLSECGMKLIYIPYVPSHAEKLLLEGHNILADQMEFLKSRLGRNSRLL
jgi:hypothetical protein